MPALQREAAWAEERLVGDLKEPVAQNGRLHLHIVDRNRYKNNSKTIIGRKQAVLKRQVRALKGFLEFCRTFGFFQEGSAESFT